MDRGESQESKNMKLQYDEKPDDMRDKLVITVQKFHRTKCGFKNNATTSMAWRASRDGQESWNQYISILGLIQKIPPIYKGKLELLIVEDGK